MSDVETLHSKAMNLAEQAFIASRSGETQAATELFQEALSLEEIAASSFEPVVESEPTRSVLYRSAAALAFHAKDFEAAEKLIARGLSGFPPPEIREELRALGDDVAFHHHIALKGGALAGNEMQMTLWGNATGFGVISSDLLVKKLEQIRKIFFRTVERLTDQPYRTAGGPSKKTQETYGLYVNGFVPSSFGVTFSVGAPAEQLPLLPDHVPTKLEPQIIIDEVITCFELLQENEFDSLQDRFEDNQYYQNFVGIARQLAPDGNSIKGIGLATLNDGVERAVGLTKSKQELPGAVQVSAELTDDSPESGEIVYLTGTLKLANSLRTRGDFGTVELIDINNQRQTIQVPVTQMQDVVQPYFEEFVTITASKSGRSLFYQDIELAEEPNDTHLTDGPEGNNQPPLLP